MKRVGHKRLDNINYYYALLLVNNDAICADAREKLHAHANIYVCENL